MCHSRVPLTLLLLLAVPAALRADEKPGTPDAPAHSLTVFHLQHASAESVGQALQIALEGRSDVQVAAIDSVSNTLFVTVHPGKLKDVAALVKSLDIRPKMLAIEVMVLELSDPGIKFEAKDIKDLTLFAGDLQQQGVVTSLEHFRVTTLEQLKATFQSGAQKPVAVGRVFQPSSDRRFGPATQYQTQSFGTLVSITAKSAGDGAVAAEVSVEQSRLRESDADSANRDSTEEPDAAIQRPTTGTLQVNTTVQVELGGTVLLGGLKTQDRQELVLLSITAAAEAEE